jgi:hypothetical protein
MLNCIVFLCLIDCTEQTIVELLVAHNANVNSKTNAQNTPLHLAAIFGHAGAGLTTIFFTASISLRFFLVRRGLNQGWCGTDGS